MKFARVLLIFTALFLLTSLVVPTQAQQATGNILVMARAADATGLDPQVQTAFTSLRLLELIYEPLVSLDNNLKIIPALAESWEFSDDAKTLTFHLRHGVKFSDGSDFTSADVKFSYQRILDEATGAAARANFGSIASIDTPDDFTVVFNLSDADVPILTAMTDINAAIISKNNTDPSTNAIGTGPFILDNWTPDQKTTLHSNPDYWGGAPKIDGI